MPCGGWRPLPRRRLLILNCNYNLLLCLCAAFVVAAILSTLVLDNSSISNNEWKAIEDYYNRNCFAWQKLTQQCWSIMTWSTIIEISWIKINSWVMINKYRLVFIITCIKIAVYTGSFLIFFFLVYVLRNFYSILS